MASITIVPVKNLARGKILSPERYDPRRTLTNDGSDKASITIGEIAQVVKKTINPASRSSEGREFVVLDTSDVREGFVIGKKQPSAAKDIGSTKKIFQQNDVLISRLRPYLRQVAIVDEGFAKRFNNYELACSTEFFVLRSLTDEPLDFLVPYLLSDKVQNALCAAQEGGHHPRFDASVLLSMPIPESLIQQRTVISESVRLAAQAYRHSEELMQRWVCTANSY
ncbi:hypothetical protein [Enterobacter quasimori]|uniref:Restriction endonuclease subunit S n=1 Tax=Enterobacter quasimori TaxID=2838947 RepID=A0ABY0AVI4_9ENTR|nr:hypothetical protein [Enterobacter quasimori]MBT1728109.1 hypothetical protein [Enterobacter quasimori]RTN25431.1 hypothetical protein EKN94_05790 [Enterobacter quasimori]